MCSLRSLATTLGLCFAATWIVGQETPAAPPYLDFVRGLRQRGFHDLAEEYARSLQQRKDIPESVHDFLLLDMAEAKLQLAQTTSSETERQQLIQEARNMYEAFVADKKKAKSPAAGEAYRQLATLLASEGHGKLTEIRYTADKKQALGLAKEGVSLFERAGKMFQQANNQIKSQLENAKPPGRQRVLQQYLETLLQHGRALLAMSVLQANYLNQQAEAGKTRQQAADLFKAMSDFRKEHALGWVGIAWYGVSQAGLNETERENAFKAVETTKEPFSFEAKRLVAYFRIRDRYQPGLEAKQRLALEKDIQTWLNTYASPKSPNYRDIYSSRETQHLRLILAMLLREEVEAMGPKARQSPTAQKLASQVLALLGPDIEGNPEFAAVARFVKFNTLRLSGRVTGQPIEKLQTFEELYLRASLEVDEIGEKMQALADPKLPAERKQQIQQEIMRHYADLALASHRALKLAGPNINPRDRENLIQFIVSAYYQQGDVYRAAVMLEYLATDPNTTPQLARKAAVGAMSVYRDLFNRNRDKPAIAAGDLNRFRRMAELLVKNWPNEPEADEARYWLGFLYLGSNRFREAAAQWEAISPKSSHFAQACAEAGELYFKLHVTERRKAGEPLSKPSPELDKALKLLQTSLDAFEKAKPAPNSPDGVRHIQAALFLAEAYALLNKPDETLKRVQPFLSAAIKNELPASLPEGSAGRIITLSLRALVQLKRMEEARKLLQDLYSAGAQQELGQGVLPILREMGSQLAEQIRRLERQGPAAQKELEETKRNFKTFLDDVGKDPKLPSEFRIWMITSYQSIGEFESAAKVASALREQASKTLAAGPPSEDKPENQDAKKAFEEAQRLLSQALYLEVDSLRQQARRVLKEKGQQEAAPLFQHAHRVLEAGMKQAKLEKHPQYVALRLLLLQDQELYSGPRGAIAGWDNLRVALQPHLERGGVIRRVYLDACYNLVYCKYQEARRLPDEQKKARALRSTAELLATFWSDADLQPRFREFLEDPDTKDLVPVWEEVRKQLGLVR